MIDSDKYVVLKRADFERIEDILRSTLTDGVTDEIVGNVVHDAVVIRRKDVFAGPGLRSYAGAVEAAMEVMKAAGLNNIGGVSYSRLRSLADWFHDQAALADAAPSVFPT